MSENIIQFKKMKYGTFIPLCTCLTCTCLHFLSLTMFSFGHPHANTSSFSSLRCCLAAGTLVGTHVLLLFKLLTKPHILTDGGDELWRGGIWGGAVAFVLSSISIMSPSCLKFLPLKVAIHENTGKVITEARFAFINNSVRFPV